MLRLNRLWGLLSLSAVFALSGCAQVQVQDLTPASSEASQEKPLETYRLTQFRDAAPSSFESRALRKQAESLCPNGYKILSRQAFAHEVLANHQAECSSGACAHQLEWQVQCGDIPREPFRFFGRIE
ncbi:hypothetical protein [Thiomicrospira sp. ALE5]|uniref:hypothetical protein n=1 Tax=Thiomicrospira sp. ALE5 TaxID=748650 RepID=UPI0008E6FE3B|nr:hypothetical protein [Thiomicrospira sp. ALE5]SFR52039.1 hypothetical protein SAMN03092900_0612 [Thiomicrospira sp. ALE5]